MDPFDSLYVNDPFPKLPTLPSTPTADLGGVSPEEFARQSARVLIDVNIYPTPAQTQTLIGIQDKAIEFLAACARNMVERQNLDAAASLLVRALGIAARDITAPK
jgi:hypothetical protein